MGVSGVCEDGVYGIACHVLLGGLCCECGVDAACTSVVCPGNMCVCGVSVSMGWSCRVSLHGGFCGWLRMFSAVVCSQEKPLWGPGGGIRWASWWRGVGELCVGLSVFAA